MAGYGASGQRGEPSSRMSRANRGVLQGAGGGCWILGPGLPRVLRSRCQPHPVDPVQGLPLYDPSSRSPHPPARLVRQSLRGLEGSLP